VWFVLLAAAGIIAYGTPWFQLEVDGLDLHPALTYRPSGHFGGPAQQVATEQASAFPYFWILAAVIAIAGGLCGSIAVSDDDEDTTVGRAIVGYFLIWTGPILLLLTGAAYLFKEQLADIDGDALSDGIALRPDYGFWLMLAVSAAICAYAYRLINTTVMPDSPSETANED